MKKKKFITSVLIYSILVCLLLTLLASCASDTKTPSANGVENSADTAINGGYIQPESTTDNLNDDLGSFDFGGAQFNILTRTADFINSAVDYEEMTGDVLNDAIYERNRRIEERFNIKFNNITTYDATKAQNSLKAGDNAYDIIMTRNPDAFNIFAQQGLISGLSTLTYINLDKPYWDKKLTDELSVANKKFFAVGSFNLTAYDFVHVLMFNKKLISDYGMPNPYDMVKNGTWTYDAYAKMAKDATRSLSGGEKMTADDAYGYLSAPKQVLPDFWISAGLKSIDKDANDIPYSTMGAENFMNIFQKIFAITWDNNSWFVNTSGDNIPAAHLTMFQNNQGLFMDCTFFYLKSLRSMESDFGILPYPKYDEQQSQYYSRMEGCELFFAPVTASQETLDRSSVILEALSSESAKTVIPVYYDLALKTKFTRDNESAEILDTLFANRVFDLGDTIWCDKVRDPIFATMFQKNNRDLVSKLDSLDKTVSDLIDKTVAAFEKLN
ncbi:MAG: extracellular solute-binding protein [Oscillospiraceae bacterium]|nr:extracellular solute-binding protein [Oscillospiraceae bacterium]